MQKINYLILGRKEFFCVFKEAGFNTSFIDTIDQIPGALRKEDPYELIITQDSFYENLLEHLSNMKIKADVFCLSEHSESDITEQTLRKIMIKAVGMEL